jgi:hypothetical protein
MGHSSAHGGGQNGASHKTGHSKGGIAAEKCVYKNKAVQKSDEKHHEFFVYVVPGKSSFRDSCNGGLRLRIFMSENVGMVEKWRHDKSIALVDVVDSFQIFVTQAGKI